MALTFGSLFAGIGGIDRFDILLGYSTIVMEVKMSNQYTYVPPCTSEELYRLYWDEGLTQTEIAKRLGTTQKVIWRAMRKARIPTRKAVPQNQKGQENPNWKGGRVLMAQKAERSPFSDSGYWYVYKPDHPHAIKNGYVAEHILVATEQAGRMLQPDECVHHKDLDKHNNKPNNLVICDRKQHRQYHLELELVAIQLYREGLVNFADGHYVISDELQEVLDARK